MYAYLITKIIRNDQLQEMVQREALERKELKRQLRHIELKDDQIIQKTSFKPKISAPYEFSESHIFSIAQQKDGVTGSIFQLRSKRESSHEVIDKASDHKMSVLELLPNVQIIPSEASSTPYAFEGKIDSEIKEPREAMIKIGEPTLEFTEPFSTVIMQKISEIEPNILSETQAVNNLENAFDSTPMEPSKELHEPLVLYNSNREKSYTNSFQSLVGNTVENVSISENLDDGW